MSQKVQRNFEDLTFIDLASSFNTSKYYTNKFLTKECNPRKYLDSISYTVDLKNLIEVRRNCAYNPQFEYSAVLLEVMVQRLQNYYRGNYLVQVWGRGGHKVYEKALKYDIISWNIFYDYFVFKTDPREEDSYIYIVCFKQDFKEIRVKNVTDQSCNKSLFNSVVIHLGMSKDCLFLGNSNMIKIIDVQRDIGSEPFVVIDPKPEEILNRDIKPLGCKLHGFFENSYSRYDDYIMCIIETLDNQLDFNRLYFWDRDFKNPCLEFYQYREVLKRNIKNDPIKKFRQIIANNEFQFGVALRTSGQVDFYWNFTLINWPQECFSDIEINYLSIFLKSDMEMKTYKIDLTWDSRIGLGVSQSYPYDEEQWSSIGNNLIKEQVKIFYGFTVIDTTFFLCYNNIVSTFDIIKKLWVEHFFFEEQVIDLLRTQNLDRNFYVGVLLKSGKLVRLESQKPGQWAINNDIPLSAGGKIKTIVSDWRDIASHYLMLEDNKIVGFQGNFVRSLEPDINRKSDDILLRYVSKFDKQDFALLSKSDQVLRIFENQTSKTAECQVKQFGPDQKIVNPWMIEDTIHTVVDSAHHNDYLLVDNKNLYILNKKSGEIKIALTNINIRSLQVIDDNYIYSLQDEDVGSEKEQGFFFQDLTQLTKNPNLSLAFKLKGALAGVNKTIDYYRQEERIAYLENYKQIRIVPILHRNVINFIGMKARDQYLCISRERDKILALDKENVITTWGLCNGKVLSQFQLKQQVVSPEFQVYQTDQFDTTYLEGWTNGKVLLYNNIKEVEVDKKAYFGSRLHTSLNNNNAYVGIEQVTFKEFKMIEIISDTEVKVHFEFVHPHYGVGQYQRIYFSNDLQYMLERLQNQRVMFYKRQDTNIPGIVRWELVRRLKQFPMDISECSYANYLFSPDLQYYLDYDKSDDNFLIKTTIDQKVKCIIPKGLMNPTTSNPEHLVKKFKWVNSQIIKIINEEGIEKMIDIQNGFKDINQDTVPMFDNKAIEGLNQKSESIRIHYYFDPEPYEVGETFKRLVRKFQKYNSTYTLEQHTDNESLNNAIFEPDFKLTESKDKVVAEMSFTYVHWKLAETLGSKQTKIRVKNLDLKLIKMLVLNIFPQGNTCLHYTYKQINILRKIYQLINTENASLSDDAVKFEIPFIQNFDGQTPLHKCMDNKNYKSADVFLQNLQDTPLDSHARAIVDIVPSFVENKLTSFGPYLDKRIMQTNQLIERGYKRAAIKYKDDLDYAIATCELWPDMNQVDQLLFEKDNALDVEVKLEFLDMTKLHSYAESIGDQFFKALADSDDMTIFQYRSIQALIDYKWPQARLYTVLILFIPFLIYHGAFIVYSNVFNNQVEYGEDQEGPMYKGHLALSIILYFFSVYFLFNEFRQVFSAGIEYFKSIWNYSDILPPMLIIVVVTLKLNLFYNLDFVPTNFVVTIHSLASLLMWLKLLYFLRIFKNTGYLVRMLTDVIWDMKVFLFILFIVYLGFSEAFMRLSEVSDEEAQFTGNYAYSFIYTFRLSLGDTGTDTFNQTVQPVTLWILWVIAAVLTNVIMLNLLISIISDSFGKNGEKAKEASYQERARIISENSYLIPLWVKNNLDDFDKYLIIATEVVEETDETSTIQNKFKSIEENILTFVRFIFSFLQKQEILNKQKELECKINDRLAS